MKHLILSVASLGWDDIERAKCSKIGELEFTPATSVFPAVTCVAQASLRTATVPAAHGMISNGYYSHALQHPMFWEQSANLVLGDRIWDKAKASGSTVGMFFFQQSLGEDVDFLISPAPIHRHEGGEIMACYTKPDTMAPHLDKKYGTFPLWRYWGPLASPKVGDRCIDFFLKTAAMYDPDIAFLYLPTLDYEAQRFGPAHEKSLHALKIFQRQLKRIIHFAESKDAHLTVLGEYAITPVTSYPVFPNKTLREAGLLKVRVVRGMAYPDFYASKAFAMVDHEVAHVYVRDPSDVDYVRQTLERSKDYETIDERSPTQPWGHPSAGDLLLTAKKGSWCAYPWWTNRNEAPEYATHIDIHNKPGFDPCELFFDKKIPIPPSVSLDVSRVGGTHGRTCNVAIASTALKFSSGTYVGAAMELAKAVQQ